MPSGIAISLSGKGTIISLREPGDKYDLIAFNSDDKTCIGKDCFATTLRKLCILFPAKGSDLSAMRSAAFLIMTEAVVQLPIPTGGLIFCMRFDSEEGSAVPVVASDKPNMTENTGIDDTALMINFNLVPSIEPHRTGRFFSDNYMIYSFTSFLPEEIYCRRPALLEP